MWDNRFFKLEPYHPRIHEGTSASDGDVLITEEESARVLSSIDYKCKSSVHFTLHYPFGNTESITYMHAQTLDQLITINNIIVFILHVCAQTVNLRVGLHVHILQ